MSTEEELLSGAQVDINEMDQSLLGDEMKETFKEESFDDGDDLYDAAIQPSGAVEKRESVDSNIMTTSAVNTRPIETNSPSLTNISSGSGSRRFQFYIGNLTWWATDEDITKAIESYSVNDILDIKFAENRQNGQSRGFATVTVGSETSGKVLMDRLPGRQLHGNLISVLPFNKNSLQRLEESTKSSGPQEKKEDKSNIPNLGTVRIGPPRTQQMGMINQMPMPMNAINGSGMMPMGYGQMAPNMMPMQSQNMASMMQQNRPMMSGPPPLMNRPPPFSTGTQAVSNVSAAQAMNSLFRNQQQSTNLLPPGTAGMVPPGTHVNPHVYPQFGQQSQQGGYRSDVSPAEFDEIMSRNKSVSSSAITRAMNDAAGGDISSAVSTLNTAISLIRQSKISSDDACKALIRTLEDALNSVDSKSDYSSRKHRRRSPSSSPRRRSRSRERSHKESSRSHRHHSHKRSRAF